MFGEWMLILEVIEGQNRITLVNAAGERLLDLPAGNVDAAFRMLHWRNDVIALAGKLEAGQLAAAA